MQIHVDKKEINFVILSRDLMRDTKLSNTAKIIYSLLCNLAASCERVYPSYQWLAKETGYVYNGKSSNRKYQERACRKYIAYHLKELIQEGLLSLQATGFTHYFFVFDYHNRNPMHIAVDPRYLDKEREQKSTLRNKRLLKRKSSKKKGNKKGKPCSVPIPVATLLVFLALYQDALGFTEAEKQLAINQRLSRVLVNTCKHIEELQEFTNYILLYKSKRKNFALMKLNTAYIKLWWEDYQAYKLIKENDITRNEELSIEIVPMEYPSRHRFEEAVREAKDKQLQGATVKIHDVSLTVERIWDENAQAGLTNDK